MNPAESTTAAALAAADLSPQAFGQQVLLGALAADAVAMPVHWYYNQSAIERDFGLIDRYHAPKPQHPDSILWRSEYRPLNDRREDFKPKRTPQRAGIRQLAARLLGTRRGTDAA